MFQDDPTQQPATDEPQQPAGGPVGGEPVNVPPSVPVSDAGSDVPGVAPADDQPMVPVPEPPTAEEPEEQQDGGMGGPSVPPVA